MAGHGVAADGPQEASGDEGWAPAARIATHEGSGHFGEGREKGAQWLVLKMVEKKVGDDEVAGLGSSNPVMQIDGEGFRLPAERAKIRERRGADDGLHIEQLDFHRSAPAEAPRQSEREGAVARAEFDDRTGLLTESA